MILVLLAQASGCAGCSVLTNLVNRHWPPVTIDQQRQTVIDQTAKALETVSAPNVVLTLGLSDIRGALSTDALRKQGISALEISDRSPLLLVSAYFDRTFGDSDASHLDGHAREIVARLKPHIAGTIVLYGGASGTLEGVGSPVPRIQVKLYPVFSSVMVKNLVVAGNYDVTSLAEVVAAVLDRFKDNVTGELTRASFTSITVPALSIQPIDLNRTFEVHNAGVAAKIELQAKPITVPVKMTGLAWLIENNHLTVVAELVPVDKVAVAGSPVANTLPAIATRVRGMLKEQFGVDNEPSQSWVGVRKDLVAMTLNAVVTQAAPCVTVSGRTAQYAYTKDVHLTEVDSISCDTEVCPTPCTKSNIDNHCDDINLHCRDGALGALCRAQQATQRQACRVKEAADRVAEQAKFNACVIAHPDAYVACPAKHKAEREGCLAEKTILRNFAGDIGTIEVNAEVSTASLSLCLSDFTVNQSLDGVRFAVKVTDGFDATVSLRYRPRRTTGHLLCQSEMSTTEKFKVRLLDPILTEDVKAGLSLGHAPPQIGFDFLGQTIGLKTQPTPFDALLGDPNIGFRCEIVNLLKPFLVVGRSAIEAASKGARGELDYAVPAHSATLTLPLPELSIGGHIINTTAVATTSALVLRGR